MFTWRDETVGCCCCLMSFARAHCACDLCDMYMTLQKCWVVEMTWADRGIGYHPIEQIEQMGVKPCIVSLIYPVIEIFSEEGVFVSAWLNWFTGWLTKFLYRSLDCTYNSMQTEVLQSSLPHSLTCFLMSCYCVVYCVYLPWVIGTNLHRNLPSLPHHRSVHISNEFSSLIAIVMECSPFLRVHFVQYVYYWISGSLQELHSLPFLHPKHTQPPYIHLPNITYSHYLLLIFQHSGQSLRPVSSHLLLA